MMHIAQTLVFFSAGSYRQQALGLVISRKISFPGVLRKIDSRKICFSSGNLQIHKVSNSSKKISKIVEMYIKCPKIPGFQNIGIRFFGILGNFGNNLLYSRDFPKSKSVKF